MNDRMKPRPSDLLAMTILALALRLGLYVLATTLTGTGFDNAAAAADGYQFVAYAHAWLGDMAELKVHPHFRRLFPGYPMLIALLSLAGVPTAAAVLFPSWLACGAVAPLCAVAYQDRRIGWAAAALTPSFVFSGALISTEALCLVFSMLGIVLAERGRGMAGGVAFGLSGLFRPVAVFAMLGIVAQESAAGRWRRAVAVPTVAGVTVMAGLAAVQWRFGEALMSMHTYTEAYGGQIFTWPFRSLIETPLTSAVPAWKLAYVGVHVLAVLGGCAFAARELLAVRRGHRADRRGTALQTTVWLGGNALYVLCIGNVWGFHDFPRFLIPALPPLFWAWRRILPTRPWIWVAVGTLSLMLALPPTKRRLLDPQVRSRPATAIPAGSP